MERPFGRRALYHTAALGCIVHYGNIGCRTVGSVIFDDPADRACRRCQFRPESGLAARLVSIWLRLHVNESMSLALARLGEKLLAAGKAVGLEEAAEQQRAVRHRRFVLIAGRPPHEVRLYRDAAVDATPTVSVPVASVHGSTPRHSSRPAIAIASAPATVAASRYWKLRVHGRRTIPFAAGL